MAAKPNDVKERFVLSTFILGGFVFTHYYVEVKMDQVWKEVGGPFQDRKLADDYAREYSADKNLDTRVVIED